MTPALFAFFLFVAGYIAALDSVFKTHPSVRDTDKEFENVYRVLQPKITLADRAPVAGDASETGSLWYNTSTNKLYIRETTGWQILN